MSTSTTTTDFPSHHLKTLRYFRNRLYASKHKRLADDCDTWMQSLLDAGWGWRNVHPQLEAFFSLCEQQLRRVPQTRRRPEGT